MPKNTLKTPVTQTILDLTKIKDTIEKASLAFDKSKAQFDTLTERAEQQAFDIVKLETRKAELTQELEEFERISIAETNIRIKENTDSILQSLLEDRGLANISIADLTALNTKCEHLTQTAEESYTKGEAEGKANAEQSFYNEKTKAEADHRVAIATKDAKISELKSKLESAYETIKEYRKEREAELKAKVDIAKNSSQPTINVNGK